MSERRRSCSAAETVAKPIAMVHHGSDTDLLWRAGTIGYLKTYLHHAHDLGFPAGISTHNPAMRDALESPGWPADFYRTALYDLVGTPEDFKRAIGVIPVGETYLSEDPPRTCGHPPGRKNLPSL